jgi:uncharacterized BrkB/YihY/UPF0761 family membrane protein
MDDITANKIVFLLLLFIVIGIIITVNTIAKVNMYGIFLSHLQNNTGNWSTIKILMMFFAIVFIMIMLYWIFRPKMTQRHSRAF